MKNENLIKKINKHLAIQRENLKHSEKIQNSVGYGYYYGYIQALKNVLGDLEK